MKILVFKKIRTVVKIASNVKEYSLASITIGENKGAHVDR